jgi:hypothetical protein
MLRSTKQIVSATRVCTRSTTTTTTTSTTAAAAAVLARPPVLGRSISTGIYRSKLSHPTQSLQKQHIRKMSGTYNKGDLSTFGLTEKQPSEGEKQLVEDVLKLCTCLTFSLKIATCDARKAMSVRG